MQSLSSSSLFNVENKVVLITGGSRGIGKMIASGFVKNGAKVYISSRSKKDCDATAKELTDIGPGKCFSIPANLQEYSEVERLLSELSAKEDKLHVLVNNAGAAWGDSIEDFPDSAWTKLLTLNLQRVFTVTQKALPLLRKAASEGGKTGESWNDPARILNIGSVEGVGMPSYDTFAYSASKAGLHQLSRHLAGRLGPEGIHSNVLVCGLFPSKMTAFSIDAVGEQLLEAIPSHRPGTPEDIAGTAIYLSSRASAFVNGAALAIDGGMLVNMPKFGPKL